MDSQLEQNRESEKNERDREHCPKDKKDHFLVFDGQLICRHFLHKIVEYRLTIFLSCTVCPI